ncbi:U-box domain-containing protein [Melia azedarach]|uniref:U-box domain-containing protein n=1 Tax=Melia azedarach TaxID=155640 RepID=A0ACC1Z0M3_MELAZ|nr:U-box domain-containing protein [Melia azedarach]
MKAPETDPINLSAHLLSSLLDQIPLVQNFKGKWVIIKTKLNDLQTQLKDFSEFSTATSNPLCLDHLYSVLHTLKDALSVAEKCQGVNLAEGKLKTQSDIDSVLAKLDRHVKDGEVLIKSGVLQEDIFSSGSKREAVRAESRNLITRLQIGTVESKNSAMDSLLGLLQEDDKNVMIAVAQGVVPVLVKLLDASSFEMKEKTVAAIARVSMVDSSKHVLIAEGLLLLNQLIRVLESGSWFAKERACVALQALSFSRENARAIGSRGGISSLLEICQAGTPGSQAFAVAVLRNLAGISEIKENFIEENAVVVLLGLAASGTALAQENAIGCLCNLVSDDENLKLLIVKEGGIESLKNFWDSDSAVRSLDVAVELLRHLASSHPIVEVLVSDGFVVRLVSVLNCGVLGVRIAAARAVHQLGISSKARKEMGECGCIGPLIKMLDGKAVEEKESAAKALSTLMSYAGNRKIFRKDERGIVSTVQLLDPLIRNLDKKYPVAILAALVHCSKCRKQMVAAGACLHLQKLAEMDVEGAKKLLENLGRGKIWGVFARP